MKKILLGLMVLVVLAVAGVAVFVATFDADRYRTLIVQKIEEGIGRPVSLGRISLGWSNGAALQLKDFAIYERVREQGKPLGGFESAQVLVRLLPLLNRDIQVVSIALSGPYFNVERSQEGKISVSGISLAGPSEGVPAPAAASSEGQKLLLSVDSIRIRNGHLGYRDLSGPSPMNIEIGQLDLVVKGFSLTRPFSFDSAMAVFSQKQNVSIRGKVLLPGAGQQGVIEDLLFKTDLEVLELQEFSQAFPSVDLSMLKERPAGKLELAVNRLEMDPAAANRIAASVKLVDGRIFLSQLRSPIEAIQLSAKAEGGDLTIGQFSASLARGTVKGNGKIDGFLSPAPQTRLNLRADGLILDDLILVANPAAPRLAGKVSLDFDGGMSGFDWPRISRSLTGSGRASLREGAVINFNVIREIFNKLSVIPGVSEKLQSRLPEDYRAKLMAAHTILQPVEFPFVIENGVVAVNDLRVAADHFGMGAALRAGLDGSLSANGILQVSPELSNTFMRSVNELQFLMNSRGEIEVPFTASGVLPNVVVVPDLKDAAAKFGVSKAQEVLGGLLKKNDPSQPASAAQGGVAEGGQPASAASSQEELIGGFLKKALGND